MNVIAPSYGLFDLTIDQAKFRPIGSREVHQSADALPRNSFQP